MNLEESLSSDGRRKLNKNQARTSNLKKKKKESEKKLGNHLPENWPGRWKIKRKLAFLSSHGLLPRWLDDNESTDVHKWGAWISKNLNKTHSLPGYSFPQFHLMKSRYKFYTALADSKGAAEISFFNFYPLRNIVHLLIAGLTNLHATFLKNNSAENSRYYM